MAARPWRDHASRQQGRHPAGSTRRSHHRPAPVPGRLVHRRLAWRRGVESPVGQLRGKRDQRNPSTRTGPVAANSLSGRPGRDKRQGAQHAHRRKRQWTLKTMVTRYITYGRPFTWLRVDADVAAGREVCVGAYDATAPRTQAMVPVLITSTSRQTSLCGFQGGFDPSASCFTARAWARALASSNSMTRSESADSVNSLPHFR